MTHELPKLPYAFDALEPHIDARTMEIHHDKHHAAYVSNLNGALEGNEDLQKKSALELLKDLDEVPEGIRAAVRNNGGGFVNHCFFWEIMKKDVAYGGAVADAINSELGGIDGFKSQFSTAAMTRFGSGWAWLGFDKDGKLHVGSTANQDSPYMFGGTPILGLDVWEHAYYLNYQNRRPDYIAAFWNVVNWDQVEANYQKAK